MGKRWKLLEVLFESNNEILSSEKKFVDGPSIITPWALLKATFKEVLNMKIMKGSGENVFFWSMSSMNDYSGAPNENIVQNHLNIELLNIF